MKNITISYNLSVACQATWNEIYPDADCQTSLEAAELVLDRIRAPESADLDRLIKEHGYQPVLRAVARIL